MDRLLPCLALTIVLASPVRAAHAQQDDTVFDADRCRPESAEIAPLDALEIVRCRQLWRETVEASRLRALASRENAEQAALAERLLRQRGAVRQPAPVGIENFLSDGDLAFGDVVVLDVGPRVFVGRPGEPSTRDDFVALESPRSPHRNRAEAYRGALPAATATPSLGRGDRSSARQER